MSKDSSWSYIIYGVVSVAAGIAAGTFGHALIDDNSDATTVIVTVFSILAGFLIALMTLLGDQSVLPGSWRIAESQRKLLEAKLIRQKWLFYIYLLTLVLIFIATLMRPHWPLATDWLERFYFGLATTAFLLSFRLPATLMEVQMDRVDAVIGARRRSRLNLTARSVHDLV
jgi:archaellum biogenesis protein FlaJ (TadC family)